LEGGAPGDDRARPRRHRQHRVGQRTRLLRQRVVQRGQGGHGEPDAGDRRPLRPPRDPLRGDRTGHDPHADLAGTSGQGPGDLRAAQALVPARPGGRARGHRGRGTLPRLRRGLVDHGDRPPRRRRAPRGQRADGARARRRVRRGNRVVLDVLVRGGRVIDGAGNPWYRADVGIAGDRIAAVGRLGDDEAARTIDADGLFVCPGFVDMHTHSDLRLLAEPMHEAKVHQGATLEVLGQDGLSYAPVTDAVLEQLRSQLAGWNGDPPGFDWSWRSVGEYLDRLDRGIAVNAAYLVPHGTLRMVAMGLDDRPPTEPELREMESLLAEGLEQGAVGLSSGLTYAPGMFADDDELVALCDVVARYCGFYCPHHRNYGSHAIEAYGACLEIARRSGCALHLAHAHLGFEVNRGKAPELLAMIDGARADGVDVTLDTYPYLAGSTYLHAYLPGWVHAGGPP